MARRNPRLVLNPITMAVSAVLAIASSSALAVPAAGTAVGSEFKANTTVTSAQQTPAVAMDASGNSVVVWASTGQDGSGYGIYAQRYDASGSAVGSEFKVNTTTAGDQTNPAVAMDAAGDFVVAWETPDADQTGIYAQRYSANGAAAGSEFIVDTSFIGQQQAPAVAMSADGAFVIAWQGSVQDGSGYSIEAKLYDAAGAAQGGEFRVNTTTTNDQKSPDVAMDGDGNFIVIWKSFQDGSGFGIYAQRYDSTGAALDGEFQINTTTLGDQIDPDIAMDAMGDFVVAWGSNNGDTGYGIYAQYYQDGSGTPSGMGEFRVNTTTGGTVEKPAVAMSATGDFTVAWQSDGQDGNGLGIYSQRYSGNGGSPLAQGAEQRVNTMISGAQDLPALAMDAFGDTTAVWESAGQDGDGLGIYAQQYAGTHEVNLGIDLSVLPAGVVMPGTPLTLSAHVSNITAAMTGNATIDAVLGAATGVKADITLPADSQFISATDANGYWNCTGPVDNVLSCDYWPTLQRTSTTDALTVDLYAPFSGGGLVLFTDQVSLDGSTDISSGNDTGATGVFLIGPIVSDALLDADRNTAKSGVLQGADLSGNTLTYSVVVKPTHGALTLQANGKYSYKPALNYTGSDSFKFKGTAVGFDSNTGTVSITVTEHAPVATNASFSMTRNTSHSGMLKATDQDKGDKLTFRKGTGPSHGSLTVSSDGSYTYTPKANYHGHDSFVFKVSDGAATVNGTVSITVK
jgi:VCBS repeat-containing protein